MRTVPYVTATLGLVQGFNSENMFIIVPAGKPISTPYATPMRNVEIVSAKSNSVKISKVSTTIFSMNIFTYCCFSTISVRFRNQ